MFGREDLFLNYKLCHLYLDLVTSAEKVTRAENFTVRRHHQQFRSRMKQKDTVRSRHHQKNMKNVKNNGMPWPLQPHHLPCHTVA